MKLSTKGRYGVRAMAELAAHYGGAPYFNKDNIERTKSFGILLRAAF